MGDSSQFLRSDAADKTHLAIFVGGRCKVTTITLHPNIGEPGTTVSTGGPDDVIHSSACQLSADTIQYLQSEL